MTPSIDEAVLLFLTLFALYSPLAALSSYLPIVGRLPPGDRCRLALGLFCYVAVFALTAIWIGEPLLELLGITTAALMVTGGIALLYAAIPMMRGIEEPAPRPAGTPDGEGASWRSVLLTPVTFPLTVGGTTFGILVAFRASAANTGAVIGLSVAGLAYAALTGVTLYAAGHLERRVSPQNRMLLERIAGILLVAIAVTLLFNGGTRMVIDALNNMKPL
ncbi:MarC family protein [Streptosporangium sp. NPDC006007]|uniref:MarC family protein n=1 Tax=Streptosporangium sp. NPDC006007 TaxID=3154575 RepID=UPI0033A4DC9C